MATTVSLGKSSTIEEYVSGSDSIKMTYSNLSLNDMMSDNTIEFPTFNVCDDYIEELLSLCKTVELDKESIRRYYQAPKLLASDIYGNSELDFLVMRLNGIYDPKDFTDISTLKLLTRDVLNTCLSKINIANRTFIDTYNENNPVY